MSLYFSKVLKTNFPKYLRIPSDQNIILINELQNLMTKRNIVVKTGLRQQNSF